MSNEQLKTDNGNREYKSDVFSMLMKEPQNALTLYNAINGSNYTDPNEVEIYTLEMAISLSVRNDASFILGSNMNIYEHQSTVCPNMPIRSLIYFAYNIRQYLKRYNIYGTKLIKIPTPKFAVFYNGDKEQPEKYDMKLSDAYTVRELNPQMELTCKVYNINNGKNRELLDKCQFLKEYMEFVDCVKTRYNENPYRELVQAIDMAIDECIQKNILREFLIANREEVRKVCALDYTFDRQLVLEREDDSYTED